MTTLTYERLKAIDDFELARRRARWEGWWTAILGRENHLLSFSNVASLLQQKRYRGIREIPVESIIGSVNRSGDFNRNFRPLKDALRQRWTQIHVLAHIAGWPPITVFQVGNLYFVEDGHHRVSVAKYLKIPLIEAEVWEYPVNLTFNTHSPLSTILGQLQNYLVCPPQTCRQCC